MRTGSRPDDQSQPLDGKNALKPLRQPNSHPRMGVNGRENERQHEKEPLTGSLDCDETESSSPPLVPWIGLILSFPG